MFGNEYFLWGLSATKRSYTAGVHARRKDARHINWRKMKSNLFQRKFFILAAFAVLSTVWGRVKATEIGYRVEETRKSIESLESQIATQEKNLQEASSPANLAEAASRKLGMIPAPLESLRFMDAGEAQDIAASRSLPTRLWKKLRLWYHPTS